MSLGTDTQTEEAARENEFVVIEIFKIELLDGRNLFLTSNNENVEWNGDTYIAFPIRREKISQQGERSVGDLNITLGDIDNIMTREILNNLQLITNAFVTIFQSREALDGGNSLGFRQVFRGRIKSMNGSLGIINFTVVSPFSDPQKPVNDRKFGEEPGMIDAFRKISN